MSVFSQMKENITTETWSKGSISGQWKEGKTCLLGHKSLVLHGEIFYGYVPDEYNVVLAQIIAKKFSDTIKSDTFAEPKYIVSDFNDNKNTTIEDIHSLLEEADKL